MFQNAAMDVAIALILMYLMLSLLCTVINEFIATKLKLRAKSLASALEQILDNQKLREAFYQHGLIATNRQATATGPQSTLSGARSIASAAGSAASDGAKSLRAAIGGKSAPTATLPVTNTLPADTRVDHPSYLSSRTVALALIGSLDTNKPIPVVAEIVDAVKKLPLESKIRDVLLSSLTEAGNDLDRLRTSIAMWFDDSMERLSGAYKRQLKWISMLIGLIVAIAFNADSFTVATTLWKDGARRASIVAIASKTADNAPIPATEDVNEAKVGSAIKLTEAALSLFPIGWNCAAKAGAPPDYWNCATDYFENTTPVQLFFKFLGLMLTAAALTLGAPFWFDMLQKFVNIRGAGSKPKRDDEKAAR